MLVKEIFVDSFKIIGKIHQMAKQETNDNQVAKEILEEFQIKYMKGGFEIISSVIKIYIVVTLACVLLFPNADNPNYKRILIVYPMLFSLCVIIEKYFETNKFIQEYSFVIFQLITGLSVVQGSIKSQTYSLYEMWIPYIIFCIYLGIFSFLNWKRQTVALYCLFALFLFLITFYYDKVSLLLYMGILLTCVFYPIICIFISFKLKELIILNKTNKDLIHTIQTILQVFPECVIIRSLDERTQQTIVKFANNLASRFLIGDSSQENNFLQITEINPQISQESVSERECFINLDEFLIKQELFIKDDMLNCAEQIIKIKQTMDQIQDQFRRNEDFDRLKEDSYFNVKSTKVNWSNDKDSYMHVFVNTTQVKKLEKERANREYQQIMFASLSHELRTPLNAFSNSLCLVQLTFDEIKSQIDKYPKIANKIESLYPRIYKFIKIGEVSSCLLMNLVDDILDMSKFEAKTFQLNIEKFNLYNLLKDIDYIFGFQCAEKNIEFSINCHSSVSEKLIFSDQKRIKQILINLISNSFKFTERGGIKIKVTEFCRYDHEFLKFEVSDTGVGISQQDIPKLFKMFGMLSKHRNKLNKSGSGLGLSISKRIVESLGGKIKVSSRENEGTKFSFTVKNMHEEFKIAEEEKNDYEQSINELQEHEESKSDLLVQNNVKMLF